MLTAFITGAGIRVGRAVALALASRGYNLALHAHRSTDALSEVADAARALGRTVHLYTADLSDAAETDALAQQVARDHAVLDLAVHNAGIFEKEGFEDITRAQYRRMQAINLDAPFFLTQGLLPSLRRAQAPLVVHITDIAGERPMNQYAHYSVSKAGLIMLTRALAVELGPHIRVNAISPGTVAFPVDFPAETRTAILRRVPLGREGSVEDIAKAVLFLAQDAPYISGQVLAVDGGRSAVL